MPLEPDSPEPDPFTSEQWQTDGGSRLDMVIDGRCWPSKTIDDVRARLGRATMSSATAVACRHWRWRVAGDDVRMSELNGQFRGKPTPTNVLSFPAGDEAGPEVERAAPGEIAIAFETVRDEAARDGKPFGDHLVHLWIHGLLHLMGHDHETDAEAEVMEITETRLLASLLDPIRAGGGGLIRALLMKIFPALQQPASRRDELENLLSVSEADRTSFDPHEEALLRNILGLQDLNASDVMIPRADIVSVSMAESFSEIISQMTAANHSRLPVRRDTLDDIAGIITSRMSCASSCRQGARHRHAAAPGAVVAPTIRLLDLLLKCDCGGGTWRWSSMNSAVSTG